MHVFCNQLFHANDFILFSVDSFKHTLMREGIILNKTEANEWVNKIRPILVESMVTLKDYWFLTTTFSIFLQDNDRDNCDSKSKIGYQTEPISII